MKTTLAILAAFVAFTSTLLADEFWVLKTIRPGVRVTYLKYVLHNFCVRPPKLRVFPTDAAATSAWRAQMVANARQIASLEAPKYVNRPGQTVAW